MDSYNNDSDAQLVPFLKELAVSIETKQLSQDQLQCISEFYMSYKFREKINRNVKEEEDEEFEDMDIIKFITMGWYMYRILSEKNNPTGPVDPNS